MTSIIQPAQLLSTARANLGQLSVYTAMTFHDMKVRETANNRGMWVDAIVEMAGNDKEDAYAWCAMFVESCWRMAGASAMSVIDTTRVDWGGSVHRNWVNTFKLNPSACIWRAAALDGNAKVLPGDALIRFELINPSKGYVIGNAKNGHTEIVVQVHGDGRIDTVGGNTTSGDSRDGNGVFFKRGEYTLHQDRVVGFIRPQWRNSKVDG